MSKKLLFVLVWFLFAITSPAQFTSVTGTVTDLDSQTWNNGSWSVSIYNPNPQSPPSINGTALTPSQLNQSGALNSSGALSLTLADSSQIAPTGTYWVFTLCPNASAQCAVVSTPVSGASQNISSILSTNLNGPRFTANTNNGGSFGYLDAEVKPAPNPGGEYYNVTLACKRIWSGSAWSCINTGSFPAAITALSGDGSATGPGAVTFTLANVNSSSGTCGDSTHVCQVVTNTKGLTTSQSAVAIALHNSAGATNELQTSNGSGGFLDSGCSAAGGSLSCTNISSTNPQALPSGSTIGSLNPCLSNGTNCPTTSYSPTCTGTSGAPGWSCYTNIGGTLIEWGITNNITPGGGNLSATVAITFPQAFSANPVVILTPNGCPNSADCSSSAQSNTTISQVTGSLSTSGLTAYVSTSTVIAGGGATIVSPIAVHWQAIGLPIP